MRIEVWTGFIDLQVNPEDKCVFDSQHPRFQVEGVKGLMEWLSKEQPDQWSIATQSPCVLRAIEIYSKLNNLNDHTKVFIIDEDGESTIHQIGDLSDAYGQFAKPFNALDEIEYGGNNNG